MDMLRTAESVTEGQCDKIADQISDAVVDAVISKDPHGSVACETLISNGFCIVAGEMTTEAYVPIVEIAKNTIREIGYTDGSYGFDYRSAGVITALNERTSDLARGVRKNGKQGASDMCVVVGYACSDTPQLMPLETVLAHKLSRALSQTRKSGLLPFLLPDGKVQVAVRFDQTRLAENAAIEHITVSVQHSRSVSLEQLREAVLIEVIRPVLSEFDLKNAVIAVNPAGTFTIGGPQCDTGLTGRKNISDAYGTRVAHGGGALSGKDPMRADRQGAYMARYLAKNIVAAGLARHAKVQMSYVIGEPDPIAVQICTGHRSGIDDEALARAVAHNFDLSSEAVAARLDLLKPQYRKSAAYGHFGRENDGFGWEATDSAEMIKSFG